jgi:uncharacterized protein YqfB (UPF0267 family)
MRYGVKATLGGVTEEGLQQLEDDIRSGKTWITVRTGISDVMFRNEDICIVRVTGRENKLSPSEVEIEGVES